MKATAPRVFVISEPSIDWNNVEAYLRTVGGAQWAYDRKQDLAERYPEGAPSAESLVEFAGKLCYRSWAPGLNPNVTKVRSDQTEYIRNILRSKHGSVLEHANFTFLFSGVSRVFTHELVRHRAGSAFSQESLRFVRLDDLPFWFPKWAQDDFELMENASMMLAALETFQAWMADYFHLDEADLPCPECDEEGAVTESGVTNVCPTCSGKKRIPITFHEKKEKTSFMRRFAPDGVATSIVWTANVRTLRHVIEARTDEGAEEEMRFVFDKVAQILKYKCPAFFGDFDKNWQGQWIPEYSKV